MNFLKILLLIVNVSSALAIIGLVLVQHGKGADAGASFGSSGGGASGSLFGATGSANFLSRATAVSALIFFVTCMGLVYVSGYKETGLGAMADFKKVEAVKASAAVAVPAKKAASGIPE